MSLQRLASFGGFLAALFLPLGCDSNNLAEVKGAIQCDGQPIDKGSISFFPVDGTTGTAGSEFTNGKYAVKVPPGDMKVVISWPKDTGKKKKAYDTPDSPEKSIFAEALPRKYSDLNETELKYEVKPGPNTKDWELQK